MATPNPFPKGIKSPVREAIRGVTERIEPLRQIVKDLAIDPDLKTYIVSELDELKCNAATIHLHNVERPGGGFDLHLSIAPFNLGVAAAPGAETPASPSTV